ncbi:MAG: acetyltransferase [Bryobacteraceae bacterium]|nr:MAG: acetyltransferase [Bryobacteraceae bacterium]
MLQALSETALPDLMRLSTAAGWNQTEDDWRRLLWLEPEGCFGIAADGRIVASAAVITYGQDLAWIGMVLTLPEYRGRGYATLLMRRCLDYCGGRGIRTVKLDATEMGRPVYARLGFEEEYEVQRRSGTLPSAEPRPPSFDWELDRLAFGADRRRLLEKTGCARPGRVAAYIGPVTARTVDEARETILHGGVSGPCFWDVPAANPAALALAESLGFQPVRRLMRMRRGPAIEERPEFVFALAGFEYG